MWVERLDMKDMAGDAEHAFRLSAIPDLVLVFGDTDTLKAGTALQQLKTAFPSAAQLGCSTGTFVDGTHLSDEGVTAIAVGFAETRVALHIEALHEIEESRQTGLALGEKLQAPDLAGVIVLSDGLRVNGSALVQGLQAVLGQDAVISGGLAGDGARFEETLIAIDGEPTSGKVAALGLYGKSIRIAHGSAGGWDEFGPTRHVTKSEGSTLFELDGKPALDLYESYLGDEAADLPASGLLYPLKIWNEANPQEQFVRTILAVDRDAKSLTLAGDIPEGWRARLMRGAFDRLVDGAAEAARHAHDEFAQTGLEPELCLLVSCVGRRLLMGQMTEDEVEAVADILGPETPITGYYSYGEIAPHNISDICGLHNQTVTLTLLAEVA